MDGETYKEGINLPFKVILCMPLKPASKSNKARNFSTVKLPGDFSNIIETPIIHLSNAELFLTVKLTRSHLTEETNGQQVWVM